MTSMEMKSTYQTVMVNDEKEVETTSTDMVSVKRRYIFAGAFASFFLGVLFMVIVGSGAQDKSLRLTSSKSFLEGTCAPCSFLQCKVDLGFTENLLLI